MVRVSSAFRLAGGDNSTGGGLTNAIQYEARAIDTSDPPSWFDNSSVPSGFATTSGFNLVTSYTYDNETGRTASVKYPDSTETHYWRIEHDNYTFGGDSRTYTKLIEDRTYSLYEDNDTYEVTGPVNVSYSIPEGPTLSTLVGTVTLDNTTTGPGDNDTITYLQRTDQVYDNAGRLQYSRVFYQDVPDNVSLAGDSADYLETEYAYHDCGRLKSVEAPGGLKTYYSYGAVKDTDNSIYLEDRVYSVYEDNTTWTRFGPVQVSWTDVEGRSVRGWTSQCTLTTEPDRTDNLTAGELSRMASFYDWRGRLDNQLAYHDVSGASYYTTHYLAYDHQDRLLRMRDPSGNVSATAYDQTGRVTSRWLGTDDNGSTRTDPGASPSDLIKVSETFYDTNDNGTGEPRTYVTYSTRLRPIGSLDDNSDDYTGVRYEYDNAIRLERTKPDVGPWSQQVYDNGGRVTEFYTCQNDNETYILAKTTTEYDNASRAISTKVYECTDGSATANYLETTYDYDNASRQCKVTQPSGSFTKTLYDAAGRVTGTYLCTDEGTDTTASTLDNDTVVQQTNYIYNGDGRTAATTTLYRKHIDTSTEGELSTTNAVYMVSVDWYDNGSRLTHTANYGRDIGYDVYYDNGTLVDTDANGLPDVAEGTPPTPDSSDNCIVTKYEYDAASRQYKLTNNLNQVTEHLYDDLGRRTYTIENYLSGATYWDCETTLDPKSRSADVNRITAFTYDNGSRTTQIIALDPDHDGSTDDNQTTLYTYGSTDNSISVVPRYDLLVQVQYPDGDADNDNVKFTYYADGSLATRTDQRTTEITYVYDDASRRQAQKVTHVGDDTDNTVLSITYAYDDIGRLEKITSHGNETDNVDDTTNVVNQVLNAYNGYGQLDNQTQEVDGVADDNSPQVLYTYDAANHMRLSKLTYPNTRELNYTYGSSGTIADRLSRIDTVGPLTYSFNGASWMVRKEFTCDPDGGGDLHMDLSYYNAGSGEYVGFDQFGRVVQQLWSREGADEPFKIDYGYDRASNRLYANRQMYRSHSQLYAYDNLTRLTSFKVGKISDGNTTVPDMWLGREQVFTLDQVGNQKSVEDFGQGAWYTGSFNDANEYADAEDNNSRTVTGDAQKNYRLNDVFDCDTSSYYTLPDAADNFTINDGSSGDLKFTTINEHANDNEPRAVVLTGEDVGPHQIYTWLEMPADADNGSYAGIVFGYQSLQNYWMLVKEVGNATTGGTMLYQVGTGGVKTLMDASYGATTGGSRFPMWPHFKRDCAEYLNYDFPDGFPSGKIGFVTNVADTVVNYWRVWDDALHADLAGRWRATGTDKIVEYDSSDRLRTDWLAYSPTLLKNVRLDKFRVTFNVRRAVGTDDKTCYFVFDAADQDDYNYLRIWHTSTATTIGHRVYGYEYIDGAPTSFVSGTYQPDNATNCDENDTLYVRVRYDSTDVKVWEGSSSANLTAKYDADNYCFSSTNFTVDGGFVGFGGSSGLYIDNVTVEYYDGDSWETAVVEDFELNASGDAEDEPTHDAAGNLTYDGLYGYTYDAWNRLARVQTAFRWDNGTLQNTSTVGIIECDGLGRRTVKQIGDGNASSCEVGDWEATYQYYYDAHKLIETRNGSERVLKQYTWGTQYIDELLDIGINQDPTDDCETNGGGCEVFFWALHDANYNVIGLVNPFSVARPLVERYEYTPYGQRTVYSRGWLLADVDEDGDVDMDDVIRCEGSSGVNSRCDVTGDGVVDGDDNDLVSNAIGQALLDDGDMHALFYSSRGKDEDGRPPYLTVGLCDIGHQGLLFDKEFGLNRVRTRDYNPVLARWMQGDPIGQRDSINLYEYERSAPLLHLDPSGKWTKIMCCTLCQENLLKHAEDRAAFAAKFALVRLLMRYPFAKGPLQRGGDGTIIRNPDYETQEEEKLRQLVDEIFDDEPSVLSSPVFTPERIKQYRELVLNLHNSLAYTSRDIRKLAVKCITGRDKYCDGPDKGEAYVGLSIYGVYLRHTINICQRFFTREHTDRANTYLHEASHIAANTIDADTDDPTWRVQRRFEVAGRDAWSIGRLAQVDIKYVYDYFVRKIFTPSEPEVAP